MIEALSRDIDDAVQMVMGRDVPGENDGSGAGKSSDQSDGRRRVETAQTKK